MKRAEMVQTIAACEALAAELKRTLKADAAHEYEEQGTAVSWKFPGFTVSSSISHDKIAVVSERDWLRYVRLAYPTEVQTFELVRPAWQADFLTNAVARGNPPIDVDGTVIPGLEYRPGGEFISVSVIPTAATKRTLAAVSQAIVDGRLPLGLPEVPRDT